MLLVLSERHLRQPPEGFAWLIGAIGLGALIGPLIPNTFAKDYRIGGSLLLLAGLLGLRLFGTTRFGQEAS